MKKQLVLMLLMPLVMVSVVIQVTPGLTSVELASYRKRKKTADGPMLCALDSANHTMSSSSLQDCSYKCTRDVTCDNFNIKNSDTCDIYNYKPLVPAPVANCTNYQKMLIDGEVYCDQFGRRDATSIPSKCCAVPYTLNGAIHYNCSVNSAVNNQLGCYNNNGQWVMCHKPQDFEATYQLTSTTALSPNPEGAVPLLTINGWILMQRKVTGSSMLFNQNWAGYRDGFGSAAGNDNYWLGLDKVYRLVQMGNVRLTVEIQRTSGLWYSAEYSTFSISDEVGKYQLTVAGYRGDAGDAITAAAAPNHRAQGKKFTTADQDNDVSASENCATNAVNSGGWWFGKCGTAVLNNNNDAIWTTTGTFTWNVQTSRMLIKLD